MLAQTKLNSVEVFISRALTDSDISRDEFILVNNVLKKLWWYKRRNQEFKDLKSSSRSSVYLSNNITLLFEVYKKYRK